jgi:hypothetical protein
MLTRTLTTKWPLLAVLSLCACAEQLPIGRVDGSSGAAGTGSGRAGQGGDGSGGRSATGGSGEGRAGSDGSAGADAGAGGSAPTLCGGELPSGPAKVSAGDGSERSVESLAVLEREVRESRAEWRKLSADGRAYSFETSSSSWIGTTCTTRIDVEAGVVVGRKQTQTRSNDPEEGDAPWEPENWFERGDEVGSHESACQAPVTLDALYDRCENEVLCVDPSENTFYLGYDAQGVLTYCGYVPQGCADDCFRGFSLDWVRVGEGAIERPETCDPVDYNPVDIAFVEPAPVADYQTKDLDVTGTLRALATPGDYELEPCACGQSCPDAEPYSVTIPPEWLPPVPDCVRVQATLECGWGCGDLTALTLSDAETSEPLMRYGVRTDTEIFPGVATRWHQMALPAECEPSGCDADWDAVFAVELEANGDRLILNDKESGVIGDIDVFLADGVRACVEDGPPPLAWIARVVD